MERITDSGRMCWAKALDIDLEQAKQFYDPTKDLSISDIMDLFTGAECTMIDDLDRDAFIYVTDLMMEESYWVYRKEGKVYSPVMDMWLEHLFEDPDMIQGFFVLLP